MSPRTFMASLAVTLLLGGTALGGLLATHPDAWYDLGIEAQWRGSTVMSNGNLSATVEWAVFGPGDYPGSGYDPESDEFVYAYQIFSTGTAPVTQLTVNMIESNEAVDIADDSALASGSVPLAAWFGELPPALQTANWAFEGLTGPSNSDILVYASVNMPVWDNLAYIVDEGVFALGPVPTPSNVIPEPATIGLLAMGGAMSFILRRRHSVK